MTRQLVSIVMPTLNQCEYLAQAIDSVLTQDYQNIELLVMDGGSSDDTLEILQKKQQKDARLYWYSSSDTGPANALNKGFALAKGTILAWLNSDDLYSEDAVQRAVNALENNWVMVYGQGEIIDKAGKGIELYPTKLPDIGVEAFSDGCFICQPTVFFKRTVLILVGTLDESLMTAFDFEFWFRVFDNFSDRVGFVDTVQAKSRVHNQSITIRMRKQVIIEGMMVIHKYLGRAPCHWLKTYWNEQQSHIKTKKQFELFLEDFISVLDESAEYLKKKELEELKREISNHQEKITESKAFKEILL